MRHRIPSALVLAAAALAVAAFAPAAASAAEPELPPELEAKLYDTATGSARDASECEGLCVFDGRGWRNEKLFQGRAVSPDLDCDPEYIEEVASQFESRQALFTELGKPDLLAPTLGFSSVINRCPFSVRLLRTDGSGVTVWPGQWIFDLGDAPYRINDRVALLEPVI